MLERLILGDTLNFTTSVADYSASAGWTLHYRLVPRSTGSAYEFSCTADADSPDLHRAQVTAATTSTWSAGTYSWHSWVTKSAEAYSVDTGSVQLLTNPRTASGSLDLRTEAQKALDDARTALAAWTPTTRRYAIGGRSMEFNSTADIIPIIQYWEQQVAQEARAAAMAKGMGDRRNIYLRMGRG